MESIRTTLFLPKEYHRVLKEIAHRKHTSMAQLIKQALNVVFFKNEQKTTKDLWGCVENTKISEAEFDQVKTKFKPFP